MKKINKNWLSSLENSVPPEAYGYTISLYSVALEGWRRGMTLKFVNNNRPKAHTEFTLSYKGKEHRFSVSRGDIVPKKAIKICVDKHLTKSYLTEGDVPTPEGETFDEKNYDEDIIEYSKVLGYPVVIKPTDGTGGNGVIANIKNEEEFRKALTYVKYDLNYSKLIVEKFFQGEDYRLYVIGEKVIGAFKKIPANVIGDGKNSIRHLLKVKNQERNSTPALYRRLIKIDKELHNILRSKGYTLDSIPKKGERIFLKTKNNVSAGGDSVDVTDELTGEIKDIAIRSSNAIPGLVQCGVDIMVNKEENTGVVLEVNSRPHITAHLYPWEGKARDIPKAIIDYYFPETVTYNDESQPAFYFDFKSVFDTFQAGFAKEITIPDIPTGNLVAARFIVSGTLQGVNYEKWVRKQVQALKLNGYIKHLQNGKTVVVVAGSEKSIVKFRDVINYQSSKRAEVTNVVEKSRKSPVKIGFEIVGNESSENLATTEKSKEIKEMKRELKKIQKERDRYKKKYKDIENSSTWRVTKPVRKLGKLIKR